MPRATARVGQVVVAETEQWEFVEDNVYVCCILFLLGVS